MNQSQDNSDLVKRQKQDEISSLSSSKIIHGYHLQLILATTFHFDGKISDDEDFEEFIDAIQADDYKNFIVNAC